MYAAIFPITQGVPQILGWHLVYFWSPGSRQNAKYKCVEFKETSFRGPYLVRRNGNYRSVTMTKILQNFLTDCTILNLSLSLPPCFAVGFTVDLTSQGPVFLFWVNLYTKDEEQYVFLSTFFMGKDSEEIEWVKRGLGQKLWLSKLFLIWPRSLSSSVSPTPHGLLTISLIKLKFNQSLCFHISSGGR